MRSEAALTVIELTISAVILVIILALVGEFLISSTRLTQQTEVRNEMQVNIRSAMEMISQDLFSAGSKGVDSGAGGDCPTANYEEPTESNYEIPLEANNSSAQDHTLTIRYCDPYGNTDPNLTAGVSTEIRYEVNPNSNGLLTLYREVETTGPLDTNGPIEAVPGIVGLEFDFTCIPTAASCVPTDTAFDPDDVVSIKIKLAAQSPSKARGVTQTCKFGLLTSSPSCGSTAGYYYEYAEQDISPPNLRY